MSKPSDWIQGRARELLGKDGSGAAYPFNAGERAIMQFLDEAHGEVAPQTREALGQLANIYKLLGVTTEQELVDKLSQLALRGAFRQPGPSVIQPTRLAAIAEMIAADIEQHPLGNHAGPSTFASREEIAELVRGYHG